MQQLKLVQRRNRSRLILRILGIALCCFLLVTPVAAAAPIGNPEQVETVSSLTSTSSTLAYIRAQAEDQGAPPALAVYIATHEDTTLDPNAIGDMNIICKSGVNKGKPYRAKGQWQLTDCGHPEVSDSCAFNLKCSTPIAIAMIKDKKTCISQFSTCAEYYGVLKKPPTETLVAKTIQ